MKNWAKSGVIYAVVVVFISEIAFPIMRNETINFLNISIMFPVYLTIGLYFNHYNYKKSKGAKKHIES